MMKKRFTPINVLLAVITVFVFLWSCFPLYWALNTSFQNLNETFLVHFWPRTWNLKNYCDIIHASCFLKYMLNSFFVSGVTVLLANVVAAPAAFALARFSHLSVKVMQFLIFVVSVLPPVVLLGGLLDVIRMMNVYDSLQGLIISYMMIVLPVLVWSQRSFFAQIPKEIEEAAVLDGVGVLRIFVKIFLPLSVPAMITSSLIAFVVAWNEFLLALTLILSDARRTATVGITLIAGVTEFETPWGQIMAAAVLVTVPVVLGVLFFQRRIVSGVVMGAVKG